jgi:ABC-type nickel/cobalt efflux system permease component RcnA
MNGLDQWISGLGGGSILLGLAAALLLGIRHASDPDHVTALSTLVFTDRAEARRRAGHLGLAWGFGHGAALFLFGLPVVAFGPWLPEGITRAAEFAVGALIVALAVRLLVRWHRGYLHAHVHMHMHMHADGDADGAVLHAHPHMHEHAPDRPHPHMQAHAHPHSGESLGRSSREAFGIGLVHGVGGSAGAGVLLVAAASTPAVGTLALFVFATGTAVSMGVVSALVGHGLATGALGSRLEPLIPALGVASAAFGLWYAAAAL